MTSILANGQAAGTIGMVVWLEVLFAVMYFLMIGHWRRERKKKGLCFIGVQQGEAVLQKGGF